MRAGGPRSRRVAPYGTWRSPVTAAAVAATGTVPPAQPLRQVRLDRGFVYWVESRAAEEGRGVVVRCAPDGAPEDVTPAGVDVRSSIHEYGGGDYAVRGGIVWYVDASDQGLRRLAPGSLPRPLTGEGGRYADADITPDGRLLVAVRERGPRHELVALPTAGGAPRVLAGDADFFSSPCVSPDGRRVAWMCWRAPQMPWDASELWVAELRSDGSLGRTRQVAGSEGESIFQPSWSRDGALHVVSDRTGFWNLYRCEPGGLEPLAPAEAEVGVPQWLLGLSTYAFLDDGSIACLVVREGVGSLAFVRPGSGRLEPLQTPFNSFVPASLVSDGRMLALIGASPTEGPAVALVDPRRGSARVLRRMIPEEAKPPAISEPRPVAFTSLDGETAHAFFYPPASADHEGPRGELPPAIVMVHGGPTGAAAPKLDLSVQFWTSRGFAYIDLNYGGSSGFGRLYRERLHGRWGVVDRADAAAAVGALAAAGEIDGRRAVVRGGSAGGFTACHCLVGETPFVAGTSYFGVLDLERLAAEMHPFEAHYLNSLVGTGSNGCARYRERSPLALADRIEQPLLLFQGLEDRVVPPTQAETMMRVLRERGLPVAMVSFPGEAHGFRRAETIERSLAIEHSFACRALGLEQPDSSIELTKGAL